MNQHYKPYEIVEILRSDNHKKIEYVTTFLYHSFKPIVASYIYKQGGDYEDAKDIFQEVILIFFRQVRSSKFEAKSLKEMEGYFVSVAHHRWLKKKESDGRRSRREKEYLVQKDVLIDVKTPLTQMENNEESMYFSKTFEKLGEPCGSILLAYYGENLSIKEIATNLNIGNPEAIKVRKFRCLEKLKNLLSYHE
jgi:RNA polymerase sigma factor (sigma-70 family)